jgi:hypothetical protein
VARILAVIPEATVKRFGIAPEDPSGEPDVTRSATMIVIYR